MPSSSLSLVLLSAVGYNQIYAELNPHGSLKPGCIPCEEKKMSFLLPDYSILTQRLRYMILTFNRLDDIGHILHRFRITLYS